MLIKKCSVSPLTAPLNQPFRTALGQHDSLENFLFRVELTDGTKGYGEAAVASHITGETLPVTKANLTKIAQELPGLKVSDYLAISSYLNDKFPSNKSVVAAVETAILDAFTRQLNIPLYKFFGSQTTKLSTDITIVISGLEETAETTRQYYRQGFRSFKIKIGRDMDMDLQRVLAVKKIVRNSALILDANQGYTAEQTLKFLKNLKRHGVKPVLIEQPVPKADWEGLKQVSRLSEVAVCADESASSLEDVVKIIKEKAVPVINIKLMKFGLIQAREAATLARSAGIDLMIGGMMESPLAMTAAAHLASGMGCFKYVDLDTPFFIKSAGRIGGLRSNSYVNESGIYDLAKVKAGIGINI